MLRRSDHQNLIKPTVEAAGLNCVRADEIVHSGLIDAPMYEQLLKADVVVADLSTSNRAAIYELGVRHALRPYTTIVIAEEQIKKSPFFDLSHIVIRTYRHLGEDIGARETRRFAQELTAAIKESMAKEPKLRRDSPVYDFLPALVPPSMGSRGELVPPGIASGVQNGSEGENWGNLCFVIMGFGKKTDFETGRVLDLDVSYQNLIKPAVEAAGLNCVRADEIVHSGLIDAPMYEQLLKADVVVADLSTSNRTAIYELGVRHALRPYTTIVIAEEQIKKSPFFDLSYIVIRTYRHLGEDIGVHELRRFTQELTAAIKASIAEEPELRRDSPVYKWLEKLSPTSFAEEVKPATKAADTTAPRGAPIGDAFAEDATHSALMQQADEAQKKGDWLKSKVLFEELRKLQKAKMSEGESVRLEDPYILQRLALTTYKSKLPSPEKALNDARDLLSVLQPHYTTDTETLALWGSVHKQLWQLTKDRSHLDEAVRAYERGFYLRNDYYNGINFAFLLNVRAKNTADSEEAIADSVQARRVRKEVVQICEDWLAAHPEPTGSNVTEDAQHVENKYWVLATLAEAHVGLRENESAERRLSEAYAIASADWMKEATQSQLDALRQLIENPPSDRVPAA